ncbi:MAG: hypothetical protein ACOX2R_00235 [Anaerolineae bacterium]
MLSESNVRRRLAKVLRHEPNEAIWGYLCERYYVGDVCAGEEPVSWLADRYRELAELVRACGGRGGRGAAIAAEGTLESRSLDHTLQGEIISAEVDRKLGIDVWRATNLDRFPDHRLPEDEITRWIALTGEAAWEGSDREGLTWIYCHDADLRAKTLRFLDTSPFSLRLADPPAMPVSPPNDPSRASELRPTEEQHYLAWREREERLFAAIPPRGLLFQLKALAWTITAIHYVPEYEAVHFILTGEPMKPVRGDYQLVESVPSRTRRYVSLNLDPGLSRSDVASLYAQAVAGLPDTRNRALSDRTRELVAFCYPRVGLCHAGNQSPVSWSVLQATWNESHRQWEYESDILMGRDYRRALRKLVPPDQYPYLWE